MQFSEKDIDQIMDLGIKISQVEAQLKRFSAGFPDIQLTSTVEKGKGLCKLSQEDVAKYIYIFEQHQKEKDLVKFVPASGAASRMFKFLFNFLGGKISSEDSNIRKFYNEIERFAFYDQLNELFHNKKLIDLATRSDEKIVELLLSKSGLNYGSLPKALLPFHRYEGRNIRKAIDEHLVEGALYCAGKRDIVSLHFTVSKEHIELINEHLKTVIPEIENSYQKRFEVSFSIQDPATNTLAVDLNNNPLRNTNGELVFRPGGHGALLRNLGEIDADVVFIKNIDNVVAEWLVGDTVSYKKALGGKLLQTQDNVFEYCYILNEHNTISNEREVEIVDFLSKEVGLKVPLDFFDWGNDLRMKYLFEKLNRPIRICGVVKSSNTGGGPFWVAETDGSETLQLVETDQINKQDESQVKILSASKYANITDLVCGVKDYKNQRFDLSEYMDPDTGFITRKSMDGHELKAMELPGLWNGSMSNWNTMFVEVPMTTFNPVKTVLDLLKKEHQGEV